LRQRPVPTDKTNPIGFAGPEFDDKNDTDFEVRMRDRNQAKKALSFRA
jgi:hypothetical protein